MVTLPTKQILSVSVTSNVIFPWNAATGPYDVTTASMLRGLQNFDLSLNVTNAEVFGGESVFAIDAQEVKREIDLKFAAVKIDLYALSVMLGGSLTVGLANGSAPEVQYLAPNQTDRAPFFRIVVKSAVGNGYLVYTFPKVKLMGSLQMNMRMDNYLIPDFGARAYFDDTYVRQDGVTGAAYDWFYSFGGAAAIHS